MSCYPLLNVNHNPEGQHSEADLTPLNLRVFAEEAETSPNSSWPLLGIDCLSFDVFIKNNSNNNKIKDFSSSSVLTLNYGLFSRSFVRIQYFNNDKK